MKRIAASIVPTLVVVLAIGSIIHTWRSTPCTVHGRVTVDGRPVPAGSVLIVSDSPSWATVAFLSTSGEYEITDVPPGPVRIGIRTRRVAQPGGSSGKPVWTPLRFEDPGTSGLGLTVRRGRQRHDIELPVE